MTLVRLSAAKINDIDGLFKKFAVKTNVDKLVLICTSPESFGIQPNKVELNSWVLYYIYTELVKRLGNPSYQPWVQPPWGNHLINCLDVYPWQAFSERALVEDFINEYHMMLEAIDEKARIVSGRSMVR